MDAPRRSGQALPLPKSLAFYAWLPCWIGGKTRYPSAAVTPLPAPSSLTNSIIDASGSMTGDDLIAGGVADPIGYMDVDPMLVNLRWEANSDPRPVFGSYAFKLGSCAIPPSDGTLVTGAQCIGAFCDDENWLEESTSFGDEIDYSHDDEEE